MTSVDFTICSMIGMHAVFEIVLKRAHGFMSLAMPSGYLPGAEKQKLMFDRLRMTP